ncbi:pilus assembly protein TadE [Nocardiopsis sp. HNM0947]|uniref:Pilus assembly protein TadE n=1 Tax=Nocardiopsis coralli TaxID=2772213 RepID=A0ABR9PA81_9ACTN|nr:pilus assembly protein TadG-related protein [Nocardiopsis coralli]MBE3000753.1 pilus assembly protein TadE [Nocardiopsis coralli]
MGRFRDDQGQASVLLLFGLTLALLALTVLFVRVGGANDLRSQAQTAADAAALAAVSAMQDEAASDLASGSFPMPAYDEDAATERAEEYARANDAVLTDIRASDNTMGRNGNIVRVEVRGALCQKELEEDAGRESWNDTVCDGEEEDVDTVTGNASAIAIMHSPTDCDRDGEDLSCGGAGVDDVSAARGLIDVNLVDEEGEYTFDPDAVVFASGATVSCGSLNVIPEACETHEVLNEEFPGFYLSAGGFRPEEDSDHGHGQAIDYMVAPLGGEPTEQMDQTALTVVNWVIENHEELGVKGLIYDREIWNPARDPHGTFPGTGRPHGIGEDNTQGHVDHIHLAIGPPPMR